MANPNKANVAALANPAVKAVLDSPSVKKVGKTTMAQAQVLLTAGIITQGKLAEMVKLGLVTDGTGGGEDIFDQLKAGGISAELIAKVKAVLAEVNTALWKDAKTYIGKKPTHKFSFTEKDVKYTYEAPAEIEFAAWVKHFDSEEKTNRAAAMVKKS